MTEVIEGEEAVPDLPIVMCWKCGNTVREMARYCHHCGAIQTEELKESDSKKNRRIWLVSLFFGLQLLLCIISQLTDILSGLRDVILFDGLFVAITIGFVILGWAEIKPALSFKGFSFIRAGFYVLVTAGFSIIVQYTMDWLNYNLFEKDIYYYRSFIDMPHPLLLMLLFIAVIPGVFEELGFRGLMQGKLSKILDNEQALSITAFAFAFIHLSLLSIVWLVPFAFMLGYVRMRENTIWYGVLMHFVFNAIAVFHDLPEFYSGS